MLVEHILATRSGSDIGFYNKGGVRNRLYQGNITARHIWNIHPSAINSPSCRFAARTSAANCWSD